MTWLAVFFLMGSSSVDLLVGFFSCKLLLLLPQALQASTSHSSLTSSYCNSNSNNDDSDMVACLW
jgi:hypothetical protein